MFSDDAHFPSESDIADTSELGKLISIINHVLRWLRYVEAGEVSVNTTDTIRAIVLNAASLVDISLNKMLQQLNILLGISIILYLYNI